MKRQTIYAGMIAGVLGITLGGFLMGQITGGDPPTPTPNITDSLQAAQSFSGSNADWTLFIQEFDGVEMVLVPVGCFEMGSTDEQIEAEFQSCESQLGTGECYRAWFEDEKPAHQVCFEEPFWLDRYEVTNGQFAEFGGQAERSSDLGDDHPRERITWFEARDFCEQRGARLPSEAEWEYAARGPDSWLYPWGNKWVSDNAIWDGGHKAAVGSKPGDTSWVGALDMGGNVQEWVNGWYGSYSSAAQTDPAGPESGEYRVMRGGSWYVYITTPLRGANRDDLPPDGTYASGGFRCARSAEG